MWYELWDVETRNRIGEYASEEEALRAILIELREYGPSAISSLGLLKHGETSEQDALIAEGSGLLERALSLSKT